MSAREAETSPDGSRKSATPSGATEIHPATIPRALLFTRVRQRLANSLTCPDGSPESANIRHEHVRNVEVGGSSPLTSTGILPGRRLADLQLGLSHHPAGAIRARSDRRSWVVVARNAPQERPPRTGLRRPLLVRRSTGSSAGLGRLRSRWRRGRSPSSRGCPSGRPRALRIRQRGSGRGRCRVPAGVSPCPSRRWWSRSSS